MADLDQDRQAAVAELLDAVVAELGGESRVGQQTMAGCVADDEAALNRRQVLQVVALLRFPRLALDNAEWVHRDMG